MYEVRIKNSDCFSVIGGKSCSCVIGANALINQKETTFIFFVYQEHVSKAVVILKAF